MYALGFFITSLFGFILKMHGDKLAAWIPGALTETCQGDCFNFFSVYRCSLALIMYHSFFAIVLFGANSTRDPRFYVHETFWPLKLLVWLATFVGAFFIPSPTLSGFWHVALGFSIVYLVIQSLLFVNLAHDTTEMLVDLYEETHVGFYKVVLVSSTLFLNVSTLVMSIIYLVHFRDTVELIVVLANLLLVVFQTVVSVLPSVQEFNPRSGILQPSLVSFHMTYLVGSALFSNKAFAEAHSGLGNWLFYGGIALTLLSVAYSALSTGQSSASLTLSTDSKDPSQDPSSSYNYSFFHFVFICAAFYVALILTSWRQPDFAPLFALHDVSLSVWIKIITSWLVSAIYIFVIFAPALFPDRDFGFAN